MVKLGSILKSTMCQVIARNSVKACSVGKYDWKIRLEEVSWMPPCPGQFSTVIVDAFLPRNNLSSYISPMLIPVTRQEIWDEVFGISSIHMVWYIVCSGWKTWLIKMFEMRLRVKGDLVLLSSKSTSSYKPTQKLIKYWKSGNLILTWRNSLSFIFLDDFAHHQKSLPNVWDLCM